MFCRRKVAIFYKVLPLFYFIDQPHYYCVQNCWKYSCSSKLNSALNNILLTIIAPEMGRNIRHSCITGGKLNELSFNKTFLKSFGNVILKKVYKMTTNLKFCKFTHRLAAG